ncbi:hypothetical protein C2S52_009960 [Perilla frutescens var. hirtella]|nr:hypothetical protein C2S52_009960 [Perilla frutescens var. hirtella]
MARGGKNKPKNEKPTACRGGSSGLGSRIPSKSPMKGSRPPPPSPPALTCSSSTLRKNYSHLLREHSHLAWLPRERCKKALAHPNKVQYLPICGPISYLGISTVPVWVRLPNFPLRCWHPKALSKIATKISTPLTCDSQTLERKHISHARILVEIEATNEPIQLIPIQLPNGDMFLQKIEYEHVHKICYVCYKFGHYKRSCPPPDQEKQISGRAGCQSRSRNRSRPKSRSQSRKSLANNNLSHREGKAPALSPEVTTYKGRSRSRKAPTSKWVERPRTPTKTAQIGLSQNPTIPPEFTPANSPPWDCNKKWVPD